MNQNQADALPLAELSSIQAKIQSCDILLASGNYFVSKIIKAATRSTWSHVGVIYRIDDLGGYFVAEAVESTGIRLVPLWRFTANYRDRKPYNGKVFIGRVKLPSDFDEKKALHFAASQLGKQYDYAENFRIAAEIVTGQKWHLDNGIYNCAEYAVKQLEAGGLNLNQASPQNTPASIVSDPRLEILFRVL